jgi:predicted ATPase
MVELANERAAARRAIEKLRLIPVLFELGARPHPPRDLYRAYLRQSDVFIGIYGQQYGWVAPGSDISGIEDEYRLAAGMPKLVYVQSPAPDRAARLTEMLDRIKSDGLSYRTYHRPAELATLIADDLAILLSERFGDQDGRPDGATEPEVRSHLPVPANSFVGREEELARLAAWMQDDGLPLLTLVGPGGIGKTRLALHAAASMVEKFDRVVLVELEQVTAASAVPSAITAALHLPERSERSPLDRAQDYLASHRVLLIIDNFEQVMAAAPLLGQLVRHAPMSKVLVTSRERLRLSNERVLEVRPLTVPEESRRSSRAESESVVLFLDRAQALGAAMDLTAEDLDVVDAICRRVEGVPLAIELAAARARTLGLQELLHRLDSQLSILTSGARDLPARQRTLRSTIEWSHDLLPLTDRVLFARLGVFAGGFSLAAAETVCGGDDVPDVLDGVASLVDKTLVRTEDPVHGEVRFTMLQVIREYALEHLDAGSEAERLRTAHADYFAEAATGLSSALRRDGSRGVIDRYLADEENFRAALSRALAAQDANRLVQMSLGMWPFWWIRGLFQEGLHYLDDAQTAIADRPVLDRAHAAFVRGILEFGHGEYERAYPSLDAAVQLYTEVGSRENAAIATIPLGVLSALRREPEAIELLSTGVEEVRRSGDSWSLAFGLLNMGGALLLLERHAEAIPLLEEAVSLSEAINAGVFVVHALINLGWAQFWTGGHKQAKKSLTRAIQVAVGIGNDDGAARGLDGLAAVAATLDEAQQGAQLLGAAKSIREGIGAQMWGTDRASQEQTASTLRGRLGAARFTDALRQGASLDRDALLEAASRI